MRDFNHTVNVLVQAYLKDELAHRFCSACAVGNIVADAIGTKPKALQRVEFDNEEFEDGTPAHRGWYLGIKAWPISTESERQIKATGYSIQELRAIEAAFEEAPGMPEGEGMWRGKMTDPVWMFNGLMAVVDVLADIHGIDLTQKEEAKKLFQKL